MIYVLKQVHQDSLSSQKFKPDKYAGIFASEKNFFYIVLDVLYVGIFFTRFTF